MGWVLIKTSPEERGEGGEDIPGLTSQVITTPGNQVINRRQGYTWIADSLHRAPGTPRRASRGTRHGGRRAERTTNARGSLYMTLNSFFGTSPNYLFLSRSLTICNHICCITLCDRFLSGISFICLWPHVS